MPINSAAFYHWPTVWVGTCPPATNNEVDLTTIGEVVFEDTLSVGIDVMAIREGMFIFDFSDWPPGQAPASLSMPSVAANSAVVNKRVTVLNSYLACLYTTLWRRQERAVSKMVLSPSELIVPHLPYENKVEGIFGVIPDMRANGLLRTRDPRTYAEGEPNSADWRLADRNQLIEVDTLQASFDLLDNIFQHQDSIEVLNLADLYLRSCKASEDANPSLSLITAWTITENLLQQLWNRYIEDNRTRDINGESVPFINGERKKRLEDGRSFSAAVVMEILSMTSRLPFDLYRELSLIRKTRNSWIHDLRLVSDDMAERAVKATEEMITLVEGISLDARLAGYPFSL